jgi:membrane-bound lytic murein transglycosylase B
MKLNKTYLRGLGLILMLTCLPACQAHSHNFSQWLADFKQEAAEQGISQEVLHDAFDYMQEPQEEIIKQDRKQPEKTITFPQYQHNIVTEKKIQAARQHWQENKELLDQIEKTYGVPAPILLALWGIESNFGEHQGDTALVESLTTLAYDHRRSQFFRKQLIAALKIIQDQHMHADDLTGSWAGAMGQIQFMPTSYLDYAVDFNNDGKKDIWQNTGDALASMANYLHQKGWNPNSVWGVAVVLPSDPNTDWATVKGDKTVEVWQSMGVQLAEGAPPASELSHLVVLDNNPATAYLAFSNYNVIMDWNHSVYFATSVGLLADAIAQP